MHWLSIGLAIALGVCAVVALELLRRLRRRTSREVEAQVTATVETLEARLDELAQELSSAVTRAEEESRRSRFLGQIATTIDLDDAIASTLQAAAGLPKVDAAVVELDPDGDADERLLGSIGLDWEGGEEGGVRIFTGAPDRREARAVELSYLYAEADAPGAVHEALGVPLVAHSVKIGWLGVFSRDPDVRFGDEDVRRLEDLADRVAPAIENARRFREARQLADLDSLTGLHNRRYFHETLAREVDRAQRYQRRLSLVIVDVDGFKEINDRIGHLAGDAVLAEIAERIRQVLRSADIPCRVGGDEFAVIVPEVEVGQARQLVARIQRAVSAKPIARAGRVRVSAGVADLQPNDGPTSLFERGDESLYAAKHAGKGGLAAAE
ncbi:MAG TPA: sensor domain-containing diguanylate cyclase [Gaiellaceae bacterium]|nr:sensor domain-containing diguanylate cyclase [Gaiellaceae bacterium]